MNPAARTPLLIFDGACGFCSWAAAWAERRLPPEATTLPWQRLGDLGALGLSRQEVARAVYWVDDVGKPHRGHRAVAQALRAIGGAWRLVGALIGVPPISWLAAGVYELVSRNRHHLSRLLRRRTS